MFFKTKQTGDFTTNTQIIRLSIAALIIGAICAWIAVVLLKMIYFFTNLSFFHRFSFAYATPTHNSLHAWIIVPPILGALVIGIIARYGSEKIRGHGIPEAIEAMIINESRISPRVAFWKPISAAISIGTGGPFGAEGPIIMTGGSFGSLFSQLFKLSPVERRILLVAGAAGGMSATFAAPVSSVLFAIELLVFEFKPRSLVPIAIASSVADAIRMLILGPGPLFAMPILHHTSWNLLAVSFVIGLMGSLLAMLLTRAIYGVEDFFRKLPIHWMWWPAIGAVFIGLGGWISPRSLGVGYDSISAMLNMKLTLYTLIGLLIVKTIIWVISLGSGTSGGILAPILIIGGSLGGVAGYVFHAQHPGVWVLLGMSATFSGVTRTPFTSIIFPLELTHNLGALLPLLVTSSISTGFSSWILPRSILTEKIVRRGLHLTREYKTDPLEMHDCKEICYIPNNTIHGDAYLTTITMNLLSHYDTKTWFTVLDDDGHPVGIVLACEILYRASINPQQKVLEIINDAPYVRNNDTAKVAMQQMLISHCDWVKVINKEDHQIEGFLTIQKLMDLRRKEYEEETERKRVFSIFQN